MPSSAWKTPLRFDFAVEYLRLAKELSSAAPDEAALRSAVCRAYYAAFHCARTKTGVLSRNSVSVHFDVWNAIGILTSQDARTVKKMGLACHEDRKTADYVAEVRIDWKETAQRVLDQVRRIQSMIAGMP